MCNIMYVPASIFLIGLGAPIVYAYHSITEHQVIQKEIAYSDTDLGEAVNTSHLSDVVVDVRPIAPLPEISQKTGEVLPALPQYMITTSSGYRFTSGTQPRLGVAFNQF